MTLRLSFTPTMNTLGYERPGVATAGTAGVAPHRSNVAFLLPFSRLRSTDGKKENEDSSGKGSPSHLSRPSARSGLAARTIGVGRVAAVGSSRGFRHRAGH